MTTNDPTSDRLPSEPTADTTALPVTPEPQPVTTATATASPVTPASAPAAPTTVPVTTAPPEGPWLEGPAPFAIVLGLLGLLVAGVTLLTELTDLRFPWADLGPWSVVAAGLVVVLVGVIGLRSSRRSHA